MFAHFCIANLDCDISKTTSFKSIPMFIIKYSYAIRLLNVSWCTEVANVYQQAAITEWMSDVNGRHLRCSLKLAHYWNGWAQRVTLLPTFRWDEWVYSNHGEHPKWFYAMGCSSLWETDISVFWGLPQKQEKSVPLIWAIRVPNSTVRVTYFIWFLRLSPYFITPSSAPFHLLCKYWLLMTGPHLAVLPSIHSHSTNIYLLNTNLGAKK